MRDGLVWRIRWNLFWFALAANGRGTTNNESPGSRLDNSMKALARRTRRPIRRVSHLLGACPIKVAKKFSFNFYGIWLYVWPHEVTKGYQVG